MLTLSEYKDRLAERAGEYSPHYFRACSSEIKAADWLATQGYTDFMMAAGVGPDITARNAFGSVRTFEVKMAYRADHGWQVTKVSFNRRGDDYVLIVLPNGHVVQDHMSHHLARVGRGGVLSVSDLMRRFDPESYMRWGTARSRARSTRERRYVPRPAWEGLPPLITWR